MKKLTVLLSVLVLTSLVLTACGGTGNPSAPDADGTATMTSTPAPAASATSTPDNPATIAAGIKGTQDAMPSSTPTAQSTSTPLPTETSTLTPIPSSPLVNNAMPAVTNAPVNTSASCPTREEVDDMIVGKNADGSHKDVFVTVSTEDCAFQVNTANPSWTYTGNFPADTIFTAHRPGKDQAEVWQGPATVEFWRVTVRFVSAYKPNDDIHKGACEILRKEIANGLAQQWQFGIVAGNINCPNLPGPNVANNDSANGNATVACPIFGGVQTVAENDGAPFCKYSGAVVTGTVPTGFKAQYWDGQAIQYANAGSTIKTGEATFRPLK